MKQPVGIVKLTNVGIIKYKKGGKRFEIACYKNKAINWRNGVEKDLSEVVQILDVYTNVQSGKLVDKELLEEVFPKMTKQEVIVEILDKGEMQMGEKERESLLENLSKEILTIVQSKMVHPKSKRPYSLDAMKAAMKSINFNVKLNQPAKKQANDCMKKLQQKYLVKKADMLVQLKIPKHNAAKIIEALDEQEINIKSQKAAEEGICYIQSELDPSKYRLVNELAVNNDGVLEILEQAIVNNSIGRLEDSQYAKLELRPVPLIEAPKDVDSDQEAADEKTKEAKDEEKKAKKKEKKAKKATKYFLNQEKVDENTKKDENEEVEITEKTETQEQVGQKKPKKKNNKKKGKHQSDDEFDNEVKDNEPTEVEKIQEAKKLAGRLGQVSTLEKAYEAKDSKKMSKKNKNKIQDEKDQRIAENQPEGNNILGELDADDQLMQEEKIEAYKQNKYKCTKCKWGSNDDKEFKGHHKSDFHKHNVCQLQDGGEIVSQEHFTEMLLMIQQQKGK